VSTSDIKSEQPWPNTTDIAKSELTEIIHSVKPDKKKKYISDQIGYHQTDSKKHRLPRGNSFPNEIAEEWIRAKYPEVVYLINFPRDAKTGYLDHWTPKIDIPPLDELPWAYRRCCIENLKLKERNRILQEANDRMEQKLKKKGRPKKM